MKINLLLTLLVSSFLPEMVVRRYSFAYRRSNPGMFPHVCGICIPERRFMRPKDIQNHDSAKHGASCLVQTPYRPMATYRATRPAFSSTLPWSFSNYSPSSSATSNSRPSLSGEPKSQLEDLVPSSLNRFVANYIEPDTSYTEACKAVVHRLSEFMKNNFPSSLRPSEVIKSGSLGKGTAVKGKSDADLVVFLSSPEYSTISDVRNNMKAILDKMETYLIHGECTIEKQSPHAVKVVVKARGDEIAVDILPSTDILKRYSGREIYRQMKNVSPYEREFYSAALAPRQLEFVSSRPTKLKSLIRLVKYWRKTAFKETPSGDYTKLPSSYPLELIVIGEWSDAGKPTDFDLQKGFYNVLKALENYRNLQHIWTVHYDRDDVPRHLLSKPYVIDPANPFNDVMTACNCWPRVSARARDFLAKPLFNDIRYSVSSTSWR